MYNIYFSSIIINIWWVKFQQNEFLFEAYEEDN